MPLISPTSAPMSVAEMVGRWFLNKYRLRMFAAAAEDTNSVQSTARVLRKQGVPVEMAVLILATRS